MNWIFPEINPDDVQALKKSAGLSEIAAQVAIHRGLLQADSVLNYLNPKLEDLTHPSKIKDLEKAALRILDEAEVGRPVRVFTDYDVDGTTGAAFLSWFFREMKIPHEIRQPDRFKDGYGLNVQAVLDAVQEGVKVMITVDCGITAFEPAAAAVQGNLDLIIVDHHQVDPVKGVPPVFAALNPHRADCDSGLKQLCGCALAFYLAIFLRTKAKERNWFVDKQIPMPNLRNHLDLVVLATAADQVPLIGDNRILVRHGIQVLQNTSKPGLKAMMQQAGLTAEKLSPSALGFTLGPRINASGRLGSAETAFKVLSTPDVQEANQLAAELESINKTRAELQNQIWDEVKVRAEQGLDQGKFPQGIVVADSRWHEGVVGIVASKVVDQLAKPAVVLAIREDGIAKGSVRSVKGVDVLKALHACADLLLGFGGHKVAAGLSLKPDNITLFTEKFNQALIDAKTQEYEPEIHLDGRAELSDLNIRDLEQLEQFGPFGTGNREPVFAFRAQLQSIEPLKGRHLRLKFRSDGRNLDGIWFGAAEDQDRLQKLEFACQNSQSVEIAAIPEINRFRGNAKPNLRVRDIRTAPEECGKLRQGIS